MEFEEYALNVLINDFDLEAEKIKEEDNETPDFIVLDNENVIFVELKEKDSSNDYLKEREEALDAGNLYTSSTSLENCKNISNIIKKAKDQMNSRSNDADFRIVWLHAKGRESEALFEKFINTLYGKADIFELGENKDNKSCYYYDYSDFFRYKDCLDGAILSKGDDMLLAINNMSKKYIQLLESDFVNRFEECILDPVQLEQNGKAWIADCDIPRKKEDEVNSYLKKKYGLQNPRRIRFNEVRVEYALPHERKTRE